MAWGDGTPRSMRRQISFAIVQIILRMKKANHSHIFFRLRKILDEKSPNSG